MPKSFISRRVSEFVGVALFALALIWLISLASYSASDPVWFFNTGSKVPPANFAGPLPKRGTAVTGLVLSVIQVRRRGCPARVYCPRSMSRNRDGWRAGSESAPSHALRIVRGERHKRSDVSG